VVFIARLKCPNCGSTRLYQEVTVVHRHKLNSKDEYDYIKSSSATSNTDTFFEPVYCDKCGWNDLDNPSTLRYGVNEGKDYEVKM
jgi:predicted RNA-binding Zn-ribbon protein involved in translation (DUF1610 family)